MVVPVKLIAPVAVTMVVPFEMEAPVPRFASEIVEPVTVKLLIWTVPPIVPCKVTVPVVARRERFLPVISPLSVPVNKMFPLPELKVAFAV